MVDLGFGFMRLPLNDKENITSIDYDKLTKLVDLYMNKGSNYFDTSYPYHNGLSEKALRKTVIEKYPRESYKILNKLPIFAIEHKEEMNNIFNEQLKRCNIDYFDYYLLHNTSIWDKENFTQQDVFDFIHSKIKEGKIKHFGISTHENSEFLEELLQNHDEIEFVQLQINYLDWDNPLIESRKLYDVARKYNKDIIIMEPLKGGTLVKLPKIAQNILKITNPNVGIASWAIRFCTNLDGIKLILSGMNDEKQVMDNLESVYDMNKLSDNEIKMLDNVKNIIRKADIIPCTYCNYCLSYCPVNIPISSYFALYNDYKTELEFFNNQVNSYNHIISKGYSKASMCLNCNKCSNQCPQHLNIPNYLNLIKDNFEC